MRKFDNYITGQQNSTAHRKQLTLSTKLKEKKPYIVTVPNTTKEKHTINRLGSLVSKSLKSKVKTELWQQKKVAVKVDVIERFRPRTASFKRREKPNVCGGGHVKNNFT